MNTSCSSRGRASLFVLCSAFLWPGSLFPQGALTPPGGPLPTMKSLDQLDAKLEARTPISAIPFTITAPGSYYLTNNVTVAVPDGVGIIIQADDVTIDLNGFTMVGGGGGTAYGIRAAVTQQNICIRNGTVRGFANGGVRGENCRNSFFEALRVSDIGGGGSGTLTAGIAAGPGSTVKDCVVHAMIGAVPGLRSGDGCTFTGCTVTGGGSGSGGKGFDLGSFVTVVNCTAQGNTGIGISVGSGSTVTHCTASANLSTGFSIGPGSTIVECTAGANGGSGIQTAFGAEVRNCTARSNAMSGIIVPNECYVVGNNCSNNNTTNPAGYVGGLIATGEANRIEANSCVYNANLGLASAVTDSLSIIVRNSARGNTANYVGTVWATPAGNAPISTQPWINFNY